MFPDREYELLASQRLPAPASDTAGGSGGSTAVRRSKPKLTSNNGRDRNDGYDGYDFFGYNFFWMTFMSSYSV